MQDLGSQEPFTGPQVNTQTSAQVFFSLCDFKILACNNIDLVDLVLFSFVVLFRWEQDRY